MFENIEEVKEFMRWCSKMGVSRAKLGEVEFEIFPAKLANDFIEERDRQLVSEPNGQNSDDLNEEELFWSSGG